MSLYRNYWFSVLENCHFEFRRKVFVVQNNPLMVKFQMKYFGIHKVSCL